MSTTDPILDIAEIPCRKTLGGHLAGALRAACSVCRVVLVRRRVNRLSDLDDRLLRDIGLCEGGGRLGECEEGSGRPGAQIGVPGRVPAPVRLLMLARGGA